MGLCTGRTAHRGRRGIALPFLDHGTRRGEGSASRPGRSLPQGKTRYPLYRRLGGTQGGSGQVRKILPRPEFDPRTVQPVTSHYTDYATRPTTFAEFLNKYPVLYGFRKFITVFKRALLLDLLLSQKNPISLCRFVFQASSAYHNCQPKVYVQTSVFRMELNFSGVVSLDRKSRFASR